MTTFFRKYRPQTFASLVGQEAIVQTLTNELRYDSCAQAYLLYGPRGTGKTTTARLLAKAMNCQKRQTGTAEPCDTCVSCQEITRGRNVDVIEIDAASQTGVDNVRENIIENAQFKPTVSKYKIFIIDEVHMLSTSAFNALLKTLEEPPSHVVFILATTELHKLPATIVSRCQRFIFKRIPHDLMFERLTKICNEENLNAEPEILERIIAKSDGCLRDAESLLGQVATLAQAGTITTAAVDLVLPASPLSNILLLLEALSAREAAQSLKVIEATIFEGISADYFLTELIELTRTLLSMVISKKDELPQADNSPEQKNRILALARNFTVPDLIRLLDLCLRRRQDAKFSPSPHLPLELIAVEFCCSDSPVLSAPTTSQPKETNLQKHSIPQTQSTAPVSSTVNEGKSLFSSHTPPVTLQREASPLPLEQLQTLWKTMVEKIGHLSHSLTFILNTATLNSVSGLSLTLRVPYDFHRDKLLETKNKKLIERVIAEISGHAFLLSCETAPATSTNPAPDTPASLQSLAAAFGGEIVSL